MDGTTKQRTEGALLCDKPAGVTSHDLVEEVRRKHGTKAGHAGTLDPFATGLLIVLLSRATRLQRYLVGLRKTYVATARLGWRSSTGDPDGELDHTGSLPDELVLPTGPIEQLPPMTSAIKIGGERLYRKARRGEVVDRPVRKVEIYRAELVDADDERATFEIECSSGTYIRTLIETLGDAYCERLRRTAVGKFSIDDAGEPPLSLERALEFLPERELTREESERVRHGSTVPLEPGEGTTDALPSGATRLTHEGRLLAVARAEDDEYKPEVVLA